MPKKGQIITNPINGDSYEYMETANDTKGERITLKATVNTKGPLVPKHYHVLQEEAFEVVSGQLNIWVDGKTTILTAGEKMTLPKNKPHNHYNNDDVPVVYIHTVTPALDFDYLIENLVGLAADGKSKNGKYGLVQELVTLKYMDSKTFLADIPQGVQKLLMNIIAPVARLFGYRAIYKKYSDIEK
ncbi:cupin domain-containing protein [Sphingobacterium sp. SGG-5]|uniref:cupin domain-containing protein n=1 Tax=Sphingobacterium sp. SGG-5 TaxID=2710881 RepID=UPI0013E9A97D|nr:cupin domain-containing protein [Sphingobacterium sp. SGG-5]NGM63119.1 cupin domain-containing protein [Sphingobacterium sp. SGG-5]